MKELIHKMNFEENLLYEIHKNLEESPEGTLAIPRERLKGMEIDYITAYMEGMGYSAQHTIHGEKEVHIHYYPKSRKDQNA